MYHFGLQRRSRLKVDGRGWGNLCEIQASANEPGFGERCLGAVCACLSVCACFDSERNRGRRPNPGGLFDLSQTASAGSRHQEDQVPALYDATQKVSQRSEIAIVGMPLRHPRTMRLRFPKFFSLGLPAPETRTYIPAFLYFYFYIVGRLRVLINSETRVAILYELTIRRIARLNK